MQSLWHVKLLLKRVSLFFTIAVLSAASPAQSVLDLSSVPLYAQTMNAKPTLSLALSVEWPTAGAQNRGSYDVNEEYIGYYNQNMCYEYTDANASIPLTHFAPYGQAHNHQCDGKGFSGNFLNWASASAIDILRYSLTGGDRIVDTPDVTVLQRAYLPTGFYDYLSFPIKEITVTQALGAVPAELMIKPDGTSHHSSVYVRNCLDRVYFSTEPFSGVTCMDAADANTLGGKLGITGAYFPSRVRVCTQDSGGNLQDVRSLNGEDYDYCQLYPSGRYKPVGNFQKYSRDLRLAGFGYPYDDNSTRYAGVLRAPMKYVGPTMFDHNYKNETDNPRKEWNPQTGVFVVNPEGDSQFGVSGVTNYLNQFGRLGAYGPYNINVQGRYKFFDHANDLYYETLRYIQGLRPTPEALSALSGNEIVYGGFPAYSTWEDPHPVIDHVGSLGDYSCIRNNILLIADVNVNNDTYTPGSDSPPRPYNDTQNIPDFKYWTSVAGSFEANAGLPYIDSGGVSRLASGNPAPYPAMRDMATLSVPMASGTNSRYFGTGMAYWANTHDIRGEQWTDWSEAAGSSDPRRLGMSVRSYFIDVNENDSSDTVEKRRVVQYYYAAKYGGFDAKASLGGNPFTSDGVIFSNALWMRGEEKEQLPSTYFIASEAVEMLSSLNQIFAEIARPVAAYSLAPLGRAYQVANAGTGEIVYQSRFNPETWSGEVDAFRIKSDAIGNISMTAIGSWPGVLKPTSAQGADDGDCQSGKGRFIQIGQRRAGGTYSSTMFSWSSLSQEQRNALSTGADQNTGYQRYLYLRGDRTHEGNDMRVRSGVLGDIVNSGVVYQSAMPADIIYDNDYWLFRQSLLDSSSGQSVRTPVIYVGGNDGMVHAFNAYDENSAQMGHEVFAYIPSFVVDNLYQLTLPDYEHHSYVDMTPTLSEAKVGGLWMSVLTGGAGAGGQGVYALDVSNVQPDVLQNKSNLIWEFTDQDDSRLGNVMGQVRIVRIQVQDSASAATQYKWYAVVPGGVNNQTDDGFSASAAAGPSIFLLDLSKPADQSWILNQNYYRIDLQIRSGMPQGLVSLNVATDAKNTLRAIYAGDLGGQLWKVSLGMDRAQWSSVNPVKLFETPHGQSISMSPLVVSDGNAKTYVVFGTGKYIETADNDGPYETQSLYALLDSNVTIPMNALAQVSVNSSAQEVTVPSFSWTTPAQALSSSGQQRSGWYMNMPDSSYSGERMIYEMAFSNNMLYANSIIPSLGGCSGGSSRRYSFQMFGGSGHFSSEDQMMGGVFLIDTSLVAYLDPATGRPGLGSGGQYSGSGGTQGPSLGEHDEGITSIKGVLDWRELSNYGQMR